MILRMTRATRTQARGNAPANIRARDDARKTAAYPGMVVKLGQFDSTEQAMPEYSLEDLERYAVAQGLTSRQVRSLHEKGLFPACQREGLGIGKGKGSRVCYDDQAMRELELIVRIKKAHRDYEDVRWYIWLEGIDWAWPKVKEALLSKLPLPELPASALDSIHKLDQLDQAIDEFRYANQWARRPFPKAKFEQGMRAMLWMATTGHPHPRMSEDKQLQVLNSAFSSSTGNLTGLADLLGYNHLLSLLKPLSRAEAAALRPWLRFVEPCLSG